MVRVWGRGEALLLVGLATGVSCPRMAHGEAWVSGSRVAGHGCGGRGRCSSGLQVVHLRGAEVSQVLRQGVDPGPAAPAGSARYSCAKSGVGGGVGRPAPGRAPGGGRDGGLRVKRFAGG